MILRTTGTVVAVLVYLLAVAMIVLVVLFGLGWWR